MSAFVDVPAISAAVQFGELLAFVADAKLTDAEEVQAFVKDGQKRVKVDGYAKLLLELVNDAPAIFANASKSNVEAYFSLIFAFLARLTPKQHQQIASAASAALTSSTSDHPTLRISLLSTLLNSLSNPKLQFEIFLTLIKFADDANHAHLVRPYFALAGNLVTQWQLTSSEARLLYHLIYQIQSRSQPTADALKSLTKCVETFDEAQASSGVALAKELVQISVSLPEIFRYDDILSLPAVRALRDDPPTVQHYELLSLLVSGTLSDFDSWTHKNPGFFPASGMDATIVVRKMRLLTLVGLASASSTLTFTELEKALHVSSDELEQWIIDAVTHGILDARLDQSSRTLRVTHAFCRSFQQEEWKRLAATLKTWKDNVTALIEALPQPNELLVE